MVLKQRMEMKTSKLFFVAALMLAAACSKNPAEKEVPAIIGEDGILYASLETPETKTAMTVGPTSATVTWSEDDVISVFNGVDPVDASNHTQNACYKLQEVNAGVGSFAFESQHEKDANAPETVDNAVNPLVAVYCYRGIGTNVYDPSLKKITHRLPSTQSYVEGSFDPLAYSMVAVSNGGNLKFKGAVGVLGLKLTGSELIKSIEILGENIAWNGTIDVSTSEKIAAPVMVMEDAGETERENRIVYSCGNGVQLSATPTPFYIVLPVGTHNLTFKIHAAHSIMEKVANGVKIERATITPTQALEYSANILPTDLSGAGAKIANCYVVSEAGNYVFDAKTPGGTTFSGDGYTADWVWATCGRWSNADQAKIGNLISDIEYKDGKIYFSTNPSFVNIYVGNIIIGIFKDGDLKWSWHIWETIEPQDVTVAGSTFMDRNLGAMREYDPTNAETEYSNGSRGFYYQWGRKDPIPGPRGASAQYQYRGSAYAFDTSKNLATHYVTNTDVWAKATTWDALTSVPDGWTYSAENALKYPTSMLAAAMFPSIAVDDVWPAAASPCPYGYHVLTNDEAQALIDLGSEKWVRVSGSSRNGGTKIDGKLVLPFIAYRKASGEIGFNYASSPTATTVSNWLGGKYFVSKCIVANKVTNVDIVSAGQPNGAGYQNVTANLGMSVRCVKD